jgi:putative endonuclease
VTHFVYMLRCADGSLYTGAAKDWQNRLKRHMNGRAAKYTRSRRPVQLVRLETHASKSAALRAETAIKRLPKHEKEHYVARGKVRRRRLSDRKPSCLTA